MNRKAKRTLLAIAIALPAFVALQNLDRVHVDFLLWNWSIPVIYVISAPFIVGFAAGYLAKALR
jgi:uncharacterized integral membrane protein